MSVDVTAPVCLPTPVAPPAEAARPEVAQDLVCRPPQSTPVTQPATPTSTEDVQAARLVGALEEAWHSIFGDADATLATMVETIRREPWDYVRHLVTGILTSVWEQAKGLVTFLVDAVKAVATSAICLHEAAGEGLAALAVWAADGDLPELELPDHCRPLSPAFEQAQQLVTRLRAWLTGVGSGDVVDLACEALGRALTWVARLGLADRMRQLATQAVPLGSMHGAAVGMVVVTFVQPESLLGELAASSAWLKAQGAAAALVERMSAEAVGLIAATEKLSVDGEVIAAESAAVGRSATSLLRSTGANDFSKLDGPRMREFAEALGTEKAASTVARAARTLVAELTHLRSEVTTYASMRKRLASTNAMVKTVVLSEASVVARTAEEAATLAKLRGEEELFEAAHVVDAEWLRVAPTQLKADFARLGWTTEKNMPAFAAVRAEHRTTLARLRSLGADVPDVDPMTLTNQVKEAITVGGTPEVGSTVLHINAGTRGYEVVRRTGAVFEKSFPLTAWQTTQETLFTAYRDLIAEFAGSPDVRRRLVEDWPSFAAWLAKG